MNVRDLADGARCIHLIGGGGKTTLMFLLARELLRAGKTVISTTTTKIFPPSLEESPKIIVGAAGDDEVTRELERRGHITMAMSREEATGKLLGHTPDYLSRLSRAHHADCIIVEADGAAGKPIKAHADHEPVYVDTCDRVIALLGADAFDAPVEAPAVHRHELFAEISGARIGERMTPAHAAKILTDDYAKSIPIGVDLYLLINKVESPERVAAAETLADVLKKSRRYARIFAGSLHEGRVWEF